MSTDTKVDTQHEDDEVLVDAYQAQRSFKFKGHAYRPGDLISVEVYRHPRFESLVSTHYVRAVR